MARRRRRATAAAAAVAGVAAALSGCGFPIASFPGEQVSEAVLRADAPLVSAHASSSREGLALSAQISLDVDGDSLTEAEFTSILIHFHDAADGRYDTAEFSAYDQRIEDPDERVSEGRIPLAPLADAIGLGHSPGLVADSIEVTSDQLRAFVADAS